MSDENCADVRNIEEGDNVTLETEERTLDVECTKVVRSSMLCDPEVVRQTNRWHFDTDERELMVQVVDGLRRFESQEPYPHHSPLCVFEEGGESLGYIESVQIHGKIEN